MERGDEDEERPGASVPVPALTGGKVEVVVGMLEACILGG